MKRQIQLFIFCALTTVLLCMISLREALPAQAAAPEPAETATGAHSPTPEASPDAPAAQTPVPAADEGIIFTALAEGELVEVSMADYLPGVVSAEMPASFGAEALRAQAVAARTYILRRMAQPCPAHPEAAVCSDYACCQAWKPGAYPQEVLDAVRATDGEYLSFQGEPIVAAFHSSSAGFTEESGNIWSETPYLISVTTPETAEDVPGFVSLVSVPPEELAQALSALDGAADFSGDAAAWLGDCLPDSGGRVAEQYIGGVPFTGARLRSVFGLRSACFTLEYSDGAFLFTVTGYGHGVGMSQYGAQVMAREGADYAAILAHYYPGTELLALAAS